VQIGVVRVFVNVKENFLRGGGRFAHFCPHFSTKPPISWTFTVRFGSNFAGLLRSPIPTIAPNTVAPAPIDKKLLACPPKMCTPKFLEICPYNFRIFHPFDGAPGELQHPQKSSSSDVSVVGACRRRCPTSRGASDVVPERD
jgi:hypothetical protein